MPRLYQYNPDAPLFSKEDLTTLYYEQRKSLKEVAAVYGVNWKVIHRAMITWEMPRRPGHRRPSTKSYLHTRAVHPNASAGGTIAVHTLVASKKIGRPLVKGEVVHHIDGVKQNNDPDNLCVCKKSENGKFHVQLEQIAEVLYRAGHLTFSYPEGYRITPELEALL